MGRGKSMWLLLHQKAKSFWEIYNKIYIIIYILFIHYDLNCKKIYKLIYFSYLYFMCEDN